MTREIVTIANLARRMPEHGRIRLGEKGSRGQPVKLDRLRFTSHDRDAIEQIAVLYGGTVKPWNDKQHEVKTEAEAIPVVLPPDPLGGTPIYELWSRGGCQRRCDGESCSISQDGPDGAKMVEVPCICTTDDLLSCKPTTRLTVVLPDITFGGGWRLESNGWNVAHEMPGMVDTIFEFAQRGFTRAHLALESRKSVMGGKTRHFVVPVLRPAVSLDALAAGRGTVRALAPAPTPIGPPDETAEREGEGAGPPVDTVNDTSWEDDVIIDAEVVDDGLDRSTDPHRPFTDEPETPETIAAAVEQVEVQVKRRRMMALLNELGMGATERHALVKRVTNGRHVSSNDMNADETMRVIEALVAIRAGKAELSLIDDNGMAVVVRT